jgi:hypothetical protein
MDELSRCTGRAHPPSRVTVDMRPTCTHADHMSKDGSNPECARGAAPQAEGPSGRRSARSEDGMNTRVRQLWAPVKAFHRPPLSRSTSARMGATLKSGSPHWTMSATGWCVSCIISPNLRDSSGFRSPVGHGERPTHYVFGLVVIDLIKSLGPSRLSPSLPSDSPRWRTVLIQTVLGASG